MTELGELTPDYFARLAGQKRAIVHAIDEATSELGWGWLMRREDDEAMLVEIRLLR